jgi:hypothetical protein
LVDLRASMDRVIEERCAKIGDQDAVVKFSLAECAGLGKAIVEGHRGRVWKCETSRLRRSLEEGFVGRYRSAAEEISKLQAQVFPQLQQLLRRHDPRWRGTEDTHGGSLAAELPSLGALSQIVALDRGALVAAMVVERLQPARPNRQARQTHQAGIPTHRRFAGQYGARVSQELASISPGKVDPNIRRLGGIPARAEQGSAGAHARIAELKREIPIVEALLMKLEAIDQTWSEVDRV